MTPACPHDASARWLARAAAITGAMSLPAQAGQVLVAAIPGTSAADGGAELVRRYHLGGIIYFRGNIASARQVADLSNGLQRAALATSPHLPLLIGTDQEGGTVARLAGLVTEFPGPMAAAAAGEAALVRAEGEVTGRQLRALGIGLNYAPVADVNTEAANPVIGVRSYGSDPALVARLTAAAVTGLHAGGVAAVAKHFPGHGDTTADSHTGVAVSGQTPARWRRSGAPPFEAAISAGVDGIMVSHIVAPALDPAGAPASLSPRIVTGLLRTALGYQGVVTTDSLRMAGVAQGRTDGQVAVGALLAGCDQLLMPASVPAARDAIVAAVRDGVISRAALERSARRVVALKLARGLPAAPLVSPGAAVPETGAAAARRLARLIASRSVTLAAHRGHGGAPVLPATGRRVHLAGPAAPALAGPLRRALAHHGGALAPSPAGADLIVAATRRARGDEAQIRLVAGLMAAGGPVVVVATGTPQDLGLFPAAAAALATYSSSRASMAAVADVLAGRAVAPGRLPVDVVGAGGETVHRRGTGAQA